MRVAQKLLTLACVACTTLTLNSCSAEKAMTTPKQIDITIGESFKGFETRYPSVKISGQNLKEFGFMKFYEMDWNPKNASSITIKSPETVAHFSDVIHLFITEDSVYTEKGITSFDFQAGISSEDWISHEEARIKFHEILQRLVKNGWEYAADYYSPRLTQKEGFRYKKNEKKYFYLDPSYILTADEWKDLHRRGASSQNYWTLHYKNKLFMQIKLGITNHKKDSKLGVYLMFIEVVNAERQAMLHFEGEDKKHWKSKWKEMLAEAKQERAKAEEAAKAKGYTIDETYQDFMINPDDY